MKTRKIRKDRVYILVITVIAFISIAANIIQNEIYTTTVKQHQEEYYSLISEYETAMYQLKTLSTQTISINE